MLPPAAQCRQPSPPPLAPRAPAADNLLTGALAAFTPAGGGPLAAASVFNVSRNGFSAGPLPEAWHSPTLTVLDVSYNRVPGSLPRAWGAPQHGQRSAFPRLERLAVQGNVLEGPADPWVQQGGGAVVFAPTFTSTLRPGNGLLEGVPPPAAGSATAGSATAGDASSADADASGGGLSAGAIAGTEVFTKIVLFYCHERLWALVPWGHRRHPAPDQSAEG